MSLEQRVRKLERLNRILLVGLLAACISMGAFAAARRTGTITVERIITGPKGLYFEAPDGGRVARIAGSQAGGSLIIYGPAQKASVNIVHTPTFGGQVLIWGEPVNGARSAAVALLRDHNGGQVQLSNLHMERRATLEVLPQGGASLRTWNGIEQLIAEWP